MNDVFCVQCKTTLDSADAFCKHCGAIQRSHSQPLPMVSTPAMQVPIATGSRNSSAIRPVAIGSAVVLAVVGLFFGYQALQTYMDSRPLSLRPSSSLREAQAEKPVIIRKQPQQTLAASPSPASMQTQASSQQREMAQQQAQQQQAAEAARAEQMRQQQSAQEQDRQRQDAQEQERQRQVAQDQERRHQQMIREQLPALEQSVNQYSALLRKSNQGRLNTAYSGRIIGTAVNTPANATINIPNGFEEAMQALSLYPTIVNHALFNEFFDLRGEAFPSIPDADIDWMLRSQYRGDLSQLRVIKRK